MSALQSALHAATPVADRLATVSWVLIAGATLVFVLVMGLLVAALRSRRTAKASPRAWVLGGGIAFPALVLSALLGWVTWTGGPLSPEHPPGGLVVQVNARNWWWEIRYVDASGAPRVRLANEIHLPAGRPATLSLGSEDVIHSFWVPALAGKVDMLPGRVTQLRVQPRDLGTWRGQCAEFCGEQHARMALHVVVQEAADFDAWLQGQGQPAQAPLAEPAKRGLRVFTAQRCDACHSVRGLTAESTFGPDLTHVGSRLALGAGTLPNSEAALRAWVAGVQQHKPGARMPSFHTLDAEALDALAHFLWQLK
jgi:cytochrome c oxidase subunit 2